MIRTAVVPSPWGFEKIGIGAVAFGRWFIERGQSMATTIQSEITDDEISLALAEIEAEQCACFEEWRLDRIRSAEACAARVRAVCGIGDY